VMMPSACSGLPSLTIPAPGIASTCGHRVESRRGRITEGRTAHLVHMAMVAILPMHLAIGKTHMNTDPTPDALLPLPPATLHILLAVAETDRHGYAIMQDVEARTDGELRLSAGTLYRAVARMVEQGLIVEVEKRRTRADDERRRYYRITPFGSAVARAEVRRLVQLVRHAQARGLTPRAV